eukprot:tig00021357_g20798.t1
MPTGEVLVFWGRPRGLGNSQQRAQQQQQQQQRRPPEADARQERDLQQAGRAPTMARNSTRDQPCRFFAQGSCFAGDQCRFKHEFERDEAQVDSAVEGLADMHFETQVPLCKFFAAGFCKWGGNCWFRHEEQGAASSSAEPPAPAAAAGPSSSSPPAASSSSSAAGSGRPAPQSSRRAPKA